ncbi:hypothetical protein LJC19_07030 [Oxalobacter sp. OttesenSCG-928-P03]|nr:hypothetical protein [Oxalobacter sp. OttesenSCG-928-P03]
MKDKYRKKPVVIDAYRLPGAGEVLQDSFYEWCHDVGFVHYNSGRDETLVIPTLEGDMVASPGDWIIKGVAGEFYPCKHEIFMESYEALNGNGEGADPAIALLQKFRNVVCDGDSGAVLLYGVAAVIKPNAELIEVITEVNEFLSSYENYGDEDVNADDGSGAAA